MRQLQSSRVGDNVATFERPARRAAPVRARPPARRPVPPRRRRYPHEAHGRLWLAVVLALIAGAAGVIWGVNGAMQASRSRARVAALESQLSGLEQRVSADEQAAAGQARHLRTVAARAGGAQKSLQRIDWALQSVPSEAQVAGLRSELAAFVGCLPQLQREITGLGLSWKIAPGKPSSDSFKLFTSAPMSGGCASALGG